jgi:opacity protein-like surface antigen
MFNKRLLMTASALATIISAPAFASDLYISASVGINDQENTFNDGTFTSNFETGNIDALAAPLTIPSGAEVNWSTDLDKGDSYTFAFGKKINNFRIEVEYANSNADVKSHSGVSAAGIDLTQLDAGILISGNVGDLGVSTGALVADGRGEIVTAGLYFNGYYDFDTGSAWTPFIGVGIGYGDTEVTFKPSGVDVISDKDSSTMYQLMAGIGYDLTESANLYAQVRYRDSGDVSVDSALLPAEFDIENESMVFDMGLRYSF